MTETLDCQVLVCPQPVLKCKELLETKHPETCQVLVDNLAACENVNRFLSRNGYTIKVEQQSSQLWILTANNASGTIQAKADNQSKDTSAKTLVFITSQQVGSGDDTLGTKLMENFLATLPEIENELMGIILLNGGVKLAATPGKALESLKTLATHGIKILVCGTCLNHYGLLEAKAVGETTNMLDIVTTLALANKIIRP